MAHIPDNILDQILDRCDIVEVISGYIPLKRLGRNYKALCPFHHEKTPSFVVNPDKGIFHCFGCGAGGNAFSFVMKYERLEFPEVARMLAKKAGVALPEYTSNDPDKSDSLLSGIYKAHELATAYFQNILVSPQGKEAKEYLVKRGVKNDTAARFKLGFSTESWDGLLTYLKKKGLSEAIIEKSGLIIPRSDGTGYYDRFRKRLIFPIFDQKDRVIAFGGRVMDDALPKYMNSPETPIYNKSKTLFGLNLTKRHIAEKDAAVIVEGYMDLLIPYQGGVNNLIASCGTALTQDHIRLIRRHSRNIIMVYDSDKAGEMATLRNLDILLAEDMDVKIAELPKGCDPDSFVMKNSAAAFENILTKPTGLFEYKLSRLISYHKGNTIESKVKIAGEMLVMISKVNNDVLKSAYIKRLAESLGLDETSLRTEMAKPKKTYSSGTYDDKAAGAVTKADMGNLSMADKTLIGLMVEDNTLIPLIKEKISHTEFGNSLTQNIVASIFRLYEEKKPISYTSLINRLGIDGVDNLLSDIASIQENVADKKRNLEDCIRWVKKDNMKRHLDIIRNQIKGAQETGEHDKVTDLVVQYNQLMKESAHY
ncbi:MAG: DNA primase [Candidatus Omnitrophota bacterium]|nr:DNA primase [Candidatus Omnitrophota bacterium]